jgi:DHA1 family bicyclomycin/chloramphenicol resistance-like MFS transporter
MLQLALGASLLTVLGVLAWGWYHGVTREAVLPVSGADAAAVMEAEIAEPR